MTCIGTRVLAARLWFLWLRHSYRFRWAHRPLCSKFSEDILRVGPVRLCRSCVCAYGGVILCAILCWLLNAVRESSVPVLLCVMVPTIGLSMPPLYKQCPRPVRDLLRFGMGCCITLCVCVMLMGNALVSVTCAGILLLFRRLYSVMRRERKAQACNGCPELGRRQICAGCRLQADAVRAYETQGTRLLLASGRGPEVLNG